jgi:Kdo2-lipid IVA lauroyltransferase/acyltransferase
LPIPALPKLPLHLLALYKTSQLAAIGYFIAIPFIYILSLLPFPVLYLLSDVVYVLFFYVIGYRKKVVLQNLRNSFPEKSDEEINVICKNFYHYFCDLFLETFKTLTISRQKMLERCQFNPRSLQLLHKMASEKKSVILVMGHWGNWEWGGNTFSMMSRQQLYVIYHPLKNKYFDALMYRMRSRFGSKLIAMRNTFKEMLAHKAEITATAFIADQTPQPDNAYWTTFLNQDTPVFKGTEVIAKKLQMPVLYTSVKRLKRGYYELNVEMLAEFPQQTDDGEISEMHTRRLEQDIMAQPEIWLWSHRRWKHTRKRA